MNGIVSIQGVATTEARRLAAEGRQVGDQIALVPTDGVSLGQSSEPFQQTFVVIGNPVRVGRELAEVPAAQDEAGSLAQWLRGVPEHRFYGPNGRPDYNGILADLSRQSWATFPDSLEDARMPNLSTFQRSVARERAARDGQLEPQLYLALPGFLEAGSQQAAVERAVERDVRVFQGVERDGSQQISQLLLDPATGAAAAIIDETSTVAPFVVTARIGANPEAAIAASMPTVQQELGSLAAFLREVPDERFFTEKGTPNFNGVFADLARFNGATGPESLEDGTLPNVSTFQRAMARERARRDQELLGLLLALAPTPGGSGAAAALELPFDRIGHGLDAVSHIQIPIDLQPNSNIVLEGDKNAGKTSFIQDWASANGIPIQNVKLNADTTPADLGLGSQWTLNFDPVPPKDGKPAPATYGSQADQQPSISANYGDPDGLAALNRLLDGTPLQKPRETEG